ncbi:D-Ala-D-Ala carboxypeptidase family metallohydrolase [Aquimarina longa]|uniref:D-Ala-D-Ala carboxypeptidase family metallohydrolase n=1 Tax=Aquimarina longa TaxID=1080221 RepID=UPI000780F73D|nr:D-Ala-D-Ala carboxypeptidase family metallohydrolase [Aquimarina longa]
MHRKSTVFMILGVTSIAILGGIIISKKKKKKSTKVDLSPFDSPDSPDSGKCMDRKFIQMLQKLEQETKYPIFKKINSGARTAYWNSKVGGVSNSAHKIPKCKAADIATPTTAIRNRIVRAARQVGFKRIGVGKRFVHLDNDTSKRQYVAWGYPKGAKPAINPFV